MIAALLAQAASPAVEVSRTPLIVVVCYLALLVGLGLASTRFFRGTSADYFIASRSIGPFLLLMTIFGTTMTSFALVGSTAKTFDKGIGVYGLMASWSGLVHSACFYLVGIRLWAIGKRYGYLTQVQYFRDRFQSDALGYLLFPILVALVIPYLLTGLIGAAATIRGVTTGMFPELFPETAGAVPPWLTSLVISCVVLCYVFFGGIRGTTWANAFQTLLFMVTGVLAFFMIARALGGAAAATAKVAQYAPDHLQREGMFGQGEFFSYAFIPLSVAMFPHVFQHWLTARSARSFRLSVIAHPVCILIVWIPTVLIGMWAAGLVGAGELSVPNSNAVLGRMVDQFVDSPVLTGLLTAGILAAIMSTLDSQFVCLGTMFTNDVVIHATGRDRFTDGQKLWIGRAFTVAVGALTYVLSLFPPPHIFSLGVWCFTGFSGLFPLVFASLYWKRITRAGAVASILVTAVCWFVLFADAVLFPQMRLFGSSGDGEYLVLGFMPVVIVVVLSSAALVVVSLMTKPLPDSVVDRFFEDGARTSVPAVSVSRGSSA